MQALTDFPETFSQYVHDYLEANQDRYGKQYRTYFLTRFGKLEREFFEMDPHHRQPKSFPSICCIAGKMCGLFSFTCSNRTLPVLLDAVKIAYKKCVIEDQMILKTLFGNKTAGEITQEDLLEIGLYEKVSDHSNQSAGERLIRYKNLETIYAGEHQRWQRQKNSFPDYIHQWVSLERNPEDTLPLPSELCTMHYKISTAKTSDYGKICIILQASKDPIKENANNYFLSQLEKTLRSYYDGRLNFFRLKNQSAASSQLYNTLYDIILNDEMTSHQKVSLIITTLNTELNWIQQLPEQEREKSRRLIITLTKMGFMTPDILNSKPALDAIENAELQSILIETQAAHPSMHE